MSKRKAPSGKRGGGSLKSEVRLRLADVINLELACEHMTEAADVISHRGQKALEWHRAFCKRLKAQLTQPNAGAQTTAGTELNQHPK